MAKLDDAGRLALRHQVAQLIGPAEPTAVFGIYVVGSSDPAARLGRGVERQVFGEAFGNSPALLAAEYDPYEPASLFVLVVDHRRMLPAGVIRLILPSPAGFKSLDDVTHRWGGEAVELIRGTGVASSNPLIWDVATLAVDRDYRRAGVRGLVSLGLWQAVAVMAYRCHTDLLVAIIDVAVYRLLQVKLRKAFSRFAGLDPQPYLDSAASVPVWSRPELWKARMVDDDPVLYQLMVNGHGIEAAVAPPDWDRVATLAATLAVTPDAVGGSAPTAVPGTPQVQPA